MKNTFSLCINVQCMEDVHMHLALEHNLSHCAPETWMELVCFPSYEDINHVLIMMYYLCIFFVI